MDVEALGHLKNFRILDQGVSEFLVRADERKERLSRKELHLLLAIYLDEAPYTIRGAAEALGMTQPDITRSATRLTALGLIEKEQSSTDGRAVFLIRTFMGLAFLTSLAAHLTDCQRKACPKITTHPG